MASDGAHSLRLPLQRDVETLMTETIDQARELPTVDDLDRVDRRRRRSQTVTIAIVALIAIIGVVWGYLNSQTIAATQLNAASVQALDDVRTQLRAQGVPESQLPPPVTVVSGPEVDVNAIVQASSALVLAQIRNDPKFKGQPGIPGQPCQPTTPACVGPAGTNGEPGKDGAQGDAGTPGSSPACLSTPDACQGAQGAKGDQGDKGDQGVAGPPGPTPTGAAFVGDGVNDCALEITYSDGTRIRADAPLTNCAL